MLVQFPPMGVYETLFKFADATNKYMGDGKLIHGLKATQ